MTKKEKKTPFAASVGKKKESKGQAKIPAVAMVKPEKTPKKSFWTKKEEQTNITPWSSYDEVTQKELESLPSVITKVPSTTTETQKQIVKEKKREQKRLEKERKEKALRERLELKKKEKEQKMQKKLEEKQRKNLFGSNKTNKEIWKQNISDEKPSKKEVKEKEREVRRLLKEEQKRKDRDLALREMESKEKEKKEQKLKQFDEKKDREHISRLSFGKAKGTEVIDEHKQAEQQKQTMDLVRIAAEEKEIRKTKVFERKMQKEERKKEKEEHKYKMKEEENAKKKMDIHMKEEIIKEKSTNQITERNDPFVAFDSIDQETAGILSNSGYTTVEKLRQATVKDLTKTGLKKKIAQKIIAECTEFVEWQVFDSIDHF
jgi:hypothetical protein